jgi:hypothetical protein
VISQGSQKSIVLKKKTTMGLNNIPLYEGDEDPRRHWFVCEKLWDATDITDEDKKWHNLVHSSTPCSNMVHEFHRKSKSIKIRNKETFFYHFSRSKMLHTWLHKN